MSETFNIYWIFAKFLKGEAISIVVTSAVTDIIDDCSNLSLYGTSKSDRRDLLKELEAMKWLEPHPRVIKLLGCVTETGELFSLTFHDRFCL